MDLDLSVVADEPELAELVHEETDAGPANTAADAAVRVSSAVTLRLVKEVETAFVMVAGVIRVLTKGGEDRLWAYRKMHKRSGCSTYYNSHFDFRLTRGDFFRVADRRLFRNERGRQPGGLDLPFSVEA
jgi:hypothetical protein